MSDGVRTSERVRRWWDDGWSDADDSGEVRVIDSWLVEEGRVRGFGLHARRFAEACGRFADVSAPLSPAPLHSALPHSAPPHSAPLHSATRTDAFFRAVAESLPEQGRWFPRVELVDTGSRKRLRLWLRPAPPRTRTVRLWHAGPDRRAQPSVKGPDLDHLASLRTAAQAAGADEALLLSPEGHVLEGSTTSIVWWRGDTLCGPPLGKVLPGVTRALLGPVTEELATPADLANVPVWTVNALHGIRPVTEGLGREPDLARAERWQTRLEALASAPTT
ncbi:aminotransferase class IV [Lentzea sp. CA-135723]|uniref:aminotransferase class IV n=1 Tax=Lentzea sp. CA-135723 TaxID=3239950 RepID=UPI003D8A9E3F